MTLRANDAVLKMEERIAEKVGPQKFNVWFKNATKLSVAGDFLHVSTPNPFISDWIERHFSSILAEAAQEVTGTAHTLSFAIDPALARGLRKKQPDRQVDYIANNPERLARLHRRNGAAYTAVILRHKLEDFIVGPSNQLAFAAVSEVINNPGKTYHPLFLHGGCGLGKTHLLQAICNGMTEHHPDLKWRYVSGEEFTNDYVFGVKSNEQEAFRRRYRNVDVLVIDDVHFFANKRATQEEFLHTFKAIDAAGKQVVLASDAHPKMIGHFSDSLVSRFMSGMVVRIDSPDIGVRAEVLRRKAKRLNANIGEPVIQYVAESFKANIRELDGALLKIVAHAQVTGQPITLSLAKQAAADLIRQTAPVVMLSDIESVVAIFFGLTPADLHTSKKSRTIAMARAIAMFFARKHTDMSFPEIGRFMGNKDHSTVILACRRVSKLLQANDVARWMTPEGQKEQNLAELMCNLEEQLGLVKSATPSTPVTTPIMSVKDTIVAPAAKPVPAVPVPTVDSVAVPVQTPDIAAVPAAPMVSQDEKA